MDEGLEHLKKQAVGETPAEILYAKQINIAERVEEAMKIVDNIKNKIVNMQATLLELQKQESDSDPESEKGKLLRMKIEAIDKLIFNVLAYLNNAVDTVKEMEKEHAALKMAMQKHLN